MPGTSGGKRGREAPGGAREGDSLHGTEDEGAVMCGPAPAVRNTHTSLTDG